MTKEKELRAEVESLRAAYRAAVDQIRLLDDVAGQFRAAIDNLQAEQAAALLQVEAIQTAYHAEAERNIALTIKVSRLSNALAEYASRGVGL